MIVLPSSRPAFVRGIEVTPGVRFVIPRISAPRLSPLLGRARPRAVLSIGWRVRSGSQPPRSLSGSAVRPADSYVRLCGRAGSRHDDGADEPGTRDAARLPH